MAIFYSYFDHNQSVPITWDDVYSLSIRYVDWTICPNGFHESMGTMIKYY